MTQTRVRSRWLERGQGKQVAKLLRHQAAERSMIKITIGITNLFTDEWLHHPLHHRRDDVSEGVSSISVVIKSIVDAARVAASPVIVDAARVAASPGPTACIGDDLFEIPSCSVIVKLDTATPLSEGWCVGLLCIFKLSDSK